MPPKPKSHIYIIERKDFECLTDRKGRLTVVSAHATPSSANAAARAHAEKEAAKGPSWGDGVYGPDHGEKNDLYVGGCWTQENRRAHFSVVVKKMPLHDDRKEDQGQKKAAPKTSPNAAAGGGNGESSAKRRRVDAVEQVDLTTE